LYIQYIEDRGGFKMYGVQRQMVCGGAACGPSDYAAALWDPGTILALLTGK